MVEEIFSSTCIICKSIKKSFIETKHKTSLIRSIVNQVVNRSASSLLVNEIRNNTSSPVSKNCHCIQSKEFIKFIFLKTICIKILTPNRVCSIVRIIGKITLNCNYLHKIVRYIVIRINPSIRNILFFSIPIKECNIETS